MKRITKKQATAFCQSAAALIATFGFQPIQGDRRSLRAMTDLGTFIVYPPNPELEAGSFCVDINGYFPDTTIFGTWGSPERKVAIRHDISLPSGKWNVLCTDPGTVLSVWERRMLSVNARPPTPEEAAVWTEQDRHDAARWAHLNTIAP